MQRRWTVPVPAILSGRASLSSAAPTPRTAQTSSGRSATLILSERSSISPIDNNAPLTAERRPSTDGYSPIPDLSHHSRKLFLPHSSIHSLAMVAFVEPVFSQGHRWSFFALMVGIDAIQVMITYYLHFVTMGLLKAGAGCECSKHLQWLCIFSFVLIVWQEITQTLDSIEFLLSKATGVNSNVDDAVAEADPGGSDDAGDSTDDDDWYGCATAKSQSCEGGWQLCSPASCFDYDEEQLFRRQVIGFRIECAPAWKKLLVVSFTGLSKLVIEGALLYVGSLYIATSRDDEEVITSVVAVTFICTLDDQILVSFIPGKMSDALRHTYISWMPSTRLTWLWVRLRTDWRMFLDAFVVLLLSALMFRVAAFHAACTIKG